MVLLRSSAARAGYEHSLAGWCDPSFEEQLTLELRNNLRHHRLALQAGMRLCQLIVHQLDAQTVNHYGLRGNYQGQTSVTASTNNFSQIITPTATNPNHYKTDDGIECIDAIQVCSAKNALKAFSRNVIKYVWRYQQKVALKIWRRQRSAWAG